MKRREFIKGLGATLGSPTRRPYFGELRGLSKVSPVGKRAGLCLDEPSGTLLDIRSNTSAARYCLNGHLRLPPAKCYPYELVPSASRTSARTRRAGRLHEIEQSVPLI